MTATPAKTICLSYETARLIRHVYLPSNINKVRNAAPEVRAALTDFLAALAKADAS